MKKLTSILLCAVMIMTMMSMCLSASAVTLPDGGKTTNCGSNVADGYTSGGRYGKVYLTCTADLSATSTGYYGGVTTQADRVVTATGYHAIIFFYYKDGKLTNLEPNTKTFTNTPLRTYSHSTTTTVSAVQMTGTHSYASDGYGDWICGTLDK